MIDHRSHGYRLPPGQREEEKEREKRQACGHNRLRTPEIGNFFNENPLRPPFSTGHRLARLAELLFSLIVVAN